MWWQQDGQPAHTAHVTRHALDAIFPDRWIGKSWGLPAEIPEQEWAPRSPYLGLCDFYLWGMLKGKILPPNPQTPEGLKQMVRDGLASVEPAELQRVHDNLLTGLGLSLRQNEI